MSKPLLIDINALDWSEHRSDSARIASISMGFTCFHVMAVEGEGENSSTAVCAGLQDHIEAIQRLDEGDEYQTALLEGRHYFIIIHPYQT